MSDTAVKADLIDGIKTAIADGFSSIGGVFKKEKTEKTTTELSAEDIKNEVLASVQPKIDELLAKNTELAAANTELTAKVETLEAEKDEQSTRADGMAAELAQIKGDGPVGLLPDTDTSPLAELDEPSAVEAGELAFIQKLNRK